MLASFNFFSLLKENNELNALNISKVDSMDYLHMYRFPEISFVFNFNHTVNNNPKKTCAGTLP